MASGRLPLSLAEELFLGLDTPGEPGTMHLEIRFAGSLDAHRLGVAAAAAAAHHPMTRVAFASRRFLLRPPQWRSDPPAAADLIRTEVCDGTDRTIDAAREDFYSRPIDPRQAPLLRLLLARRPGGDSLLLSVHHAVMDGLGMARFLQSVGRAYAAAPDPVPEGIDPVATRDLAAAFGARFPRVKTGRAVARPKSGKRTQLAAVGAGRPGYGFRQLRLPADWSNTDLPHRDLRGTRGDYLMQAALHRAIACWNQRHGRETDLISVIMPMSVRPPEWGLEIVANLVMAGHVFTSPRERADDAGLMATVTEQMRAIKSGADFGAALHTPAWVRKTIVPALIAVAGRRLIDTAAIMTNVGAADGIYDFGPDAGEVIESWGSPPAVMPMGLGVCAGTLYGDVLITVRYCRALLDDRAATEFTRIYLEALESLSIPRAPSAAEAPRPASAR